jgi:hypothetical protein
MLRKLLPLAIATVLACATAATGLAAGSTQVEHFSATFPDDVCGFSGRTAVTRTSVFRDTGNGTYFMSGTFFGVFTADNGRSTTLQGAGPLTQTSPAVIDELARTVTITTSYGGLFEKFSITGGPTLSIDAGVVTFVDVFKTPGIQPIRWAMLTPSPRRCLYMGHIPISRAAAARSSCHTCKARKAAIAGADLQTGGSAPYR